jgi:YebC/PmpR family DNA-binding regulatory protein
MAGHSKWKNIQHRKGRQDAKKAKVFTKISKEIYAAVRNGGDDPTQNTSLRLALQKAKQANMPGDNIERTIKKASGDVEGLTYEQIVYEGYGPHGVAVMVDILTDNRNRTAAQVRHIFSKHNGNLGESGCVAYLFDRKGVLIVRATEDTEEETLLLEAIEAGAEDMQSTGDTFEIITAPSELETVKQTLNRQGFTIENEEVTQLPMTTVELSEDQMEEVLKLVDALEDNDDVQQVYTNIA